MPGGLRSHENVADTLRLLKRTVKNLDAKAFLVLYQHAKNFYDPQVMIYIKKNDPGKPIMRIIENIIASRNDKECLVAFNTLARLLRFNLINKASCDKEVVRKLAYTVKKISIINYAYSLNQLNTLVRTDVLHHLNHHLATFLVDLSQIIRFLRNDDHFINNIFESIGQYFNIGGCNQRLNYLTIKTDLITVANLSYALLFVKKIKNHNKQYQSCRERDVLSWINHLNDKWAFNPRDISFAVLQICALLKQDFFSIDKDEKIIKCLDHYLDVVTNAGFNPINYLTILEAITLVQDHRSFEFASTKLQNNILNIIEQTMKASSHDILSTNLHKKLLTHAEELKRCKNICPQTKGRQEIDPEITSTNNMVDTQASINPFNQLNEMNEEKEISTADTLLKNQSMIQNMHYKHFFPNSIREGSASDKYFKEYFIEDTLSARARLSFFKEKTAVSSQDSAQINQIKEVKSSLLQSGKLTLLSQPFKMEVPVVDMHQPTFTFN